MISFLYVSSIISLCDNTLSYFERENVKGILSVSLLRSEAKGEGNLKATGRRGR